jgi:hypothetical protein
VDAVSERLDPGLGAAYKVKKAASPTARHAKLPNLWMRMAGPVPQIPVEQGGEAVPRVWGGVADGAMTLPIPLTVRLVTSRRSSSREAKVGERAPSPRPDPTCAAAYDPTFQGWPMDVNRRGAFEHVFARATLESTRRE